MGPVGQWVSGLSLAAVERMRLRQSSWCEAGRGRGLLMMRPAAQYWLCLHCLQTPCHTHHAPPQLIVVTLLVASKGALSLPKKVDSADSLRSTLRALGGLPAEQVLGVEVLWTPQAEGDVFSREDLTKDYPSLRVI